MIHGTTCAFDRLTVGVTDKAMYDKGSYLA
jgi:hypothetical protein